MDNTGLLSGLSLFTIVIVLVALIGIYLYFLRSRRNREATKNVMGANDPPS